MHRVLRCAAALTVAAPAIAAAQTARFLDVGSERERLLRVLQLTGDVPLYPVSIRALSPAELDRLAPVSARAAAMLARDGRRADVGPARATVLPVQGSVIYNSSFAFGYNDGPVWAGRGFTGVASAGIAGRLGPLAAQFEPTVFRAQNLAFPLARVPAEFSPYGDGFDPGSIDHPQRFGPSSYGRFDPGQSTIRLTVGPLEVEGSTADQWWGPAIENPIILGDNAAGFPHVDAGTSRPLNVGIGWIHGRVEYGRLAQSAYSPDQGADSIRFMAGVVGEYIPRWLPGLELGADRFFHDQWPAGGWRNAPWKQPFEVLLTSRTTTSETQAGNGPENQLAEVFARWAFPGHGLELYAEYGRDDYNDNLRDLINEPDHESGYVVGFQRAWAAGPDAITAVRGEVMDMRVSRLIQARGQAPWYVHVGGVEQGHTELGQILGSEAGLGGGAAMLAVDRYRGTSRWTLEWARLMRAQGNPLGDPTKADVEHTLSVQWSRMRGAIGVNGGATGVLDLNRNFASDKFNLNLVTGVTYAW